MLVVHSGVPRALEGSAYAERRAACEAVAARLGLPALRDATLEQVADEPRARHVVTENARVLEAADALRAGDLATVGRCCSESHASLRDDFEVSTPELDALVEQLERRRRVRRAAHRRGLRRLRRRARRDPRQTTTSSSARPPPTARVTGLEPMAFVCRARRGQPGKL